MVSQTDKVMVALSIAGLAFVFGMAYWSQNWLFGIIPPLSRFVG